MNKNIDLTSQNSNKKNSREDVLREYFTNVSTFVSTMTEDDIKDVESFMRGHLKEKIQYPTIRNVQRKGGQLKTVDENLYSFTKRTNDAFHIVSPSGSSYKRISKMYGLIAKFIRSLVDKRDQAKNRMKVYEKEGKKVLAENENYNQANAKINNNALSGATLSEFNLFYDAGNYNSITSSARTVVTASFTNIEQLLGGNFAFFDIDQVINHVVLCQRIKPSDEVIQQTINKYRLYTPTVVDVINFLFECIEMYILPTDFIPVKETITELCNKLNQHTLIFIYYYNNLSHIFFKNSAIFKPWVKRFMDINSADKITTNPSDLLEIDEDILAIATVCNASLFEGKKTKDLIDNFPETACKIADINKHRQKQIDAIGLLLDTFIYSSHVSPNLHVQKKMMRKTVVIADTDSNFFSTINWVRWYSNNEFEDIPENDEITMLVIYLVTKITAAMLYKLAMSLGAEKDKAKLLIMKNEFFYKVLLTILDMKKHYVGLQSIKEGFILPKPKLDLKGVGLRGSSICKESTDTFKDILINDILHKGITGKISGQDIINKVVNFEYAVYDSLYRGETTYLKNTSIRLPEDYKNPGAAAYKYAEAWNVIFDGIYDKIMLPTKSTIVPLNKPSKQFMDNLEATSPIVFKNFSASIRDNGYPSFIAIHPLSETVPKELLPLVDARPIVYHNLSGVYNVLRNIGICIGYSDKELLFSDIYGSR